VNLSPQRVKNSRGAMKNKKVIAQQGVKAGGRTTLIWDHALESTPPGKERKPQASDTSDKNKQ